MKYTSFSGGKRDLCLIKLLLTLRTNSLLPQYCYMLRRCFWLDCPWRLRPLKFVEFRTHHCFEYFLPNPLNKEVKVRATEYFVLNDPVKAKERRQSRFNAHCSKWRLHVYLFQVRNCVNASIKIMWFCFKAIAWTVTEEQPIAKSLEGQSFIR